MKSLNDILRECAKAPSFSFLMVDSVSSRNIDGDTPLHVVAGWGDLEGVRVLVSSGSDINACGDRGRTPIYSAIGAGHLDVVAYLKEMGASLSVVDEDGNTPLHCAEMLGFVQIQEILHNAMGWTPPS